MSKMSSNHPQKPPAASEPNKDSRPGWSEIIVGLVVLAIVGFGVGSQLKRLGLDPVVYGLIFTALSGIAGERRVCRSCATADSFPERLRCTPSFQALAADRGQSWSGCFRAQESGDSRLDSDHRERHQCPGCLRTGR